MQHQTVPQTTPELAFAGFAPGENRELLADVHRWARTNGWVTHRDTGWQNPSRITQVDWDERGLFIGSRDGADHMWKTPRHWPAASVRQAVDMLVALDILPARLSSLADTMLRLADELESEGSTDQLDSAYRIRLVLDGEYEPTGDPR